MIWLEYFCCDDGQHLPKSVIDDDRHQMTMTKVLELSNEHERRVKWLGNVTQGRSCRQLFVRDA